MAKIGCKVTNKILNISSFRGIFFICQQNYHSPKEAKPLHAKAHCNGKNSKNGSNRHPPTHAQQQAAKQQQGIPTLQKRTFGEVKPYVSARETYGFARQNHTYQQTTNCQAFTTSSKEKTKEQEKNGKEESPSTEKGHAEEPKSRTPTDVISDNWSPFPRQSDRKPSTLPP